MRTLIIALLCSFIISIKAHDHIDALRVAKEIALGNSSRINPHLHMKKRKRTISTDFEYASSKRAVIIGASVGMGKELAKMLAADGYIIGITSRRVELLQELQQEISSPTYIAQMDVSQPDEATEILNRLIEEMGGLDLLIIAATGFWDCDFEDNDWKKSLAVLTVDVVGFFALARTALNYFEEQGYGHLVGFSSIDGLHGVASCQAYSASKAFCSRYLEAERNKFIQKNVPIYVTELCPGWINSRGNLNFDELSHAYWVESLDDAMKDIYDAIKNKEEVAYITRRWQKVAELLKNIPSDLYNALSARPGGGF